MGQRQLPHARFPGHPPRLPGSRVAGLHRPILLLVDEGGLVDQQVGPAGRLHQRRHRPGIARIDHFPARPRGAHQLLGTDLPAVVQANVLAPMDLAPERPFWHAQLPGQIGVEPPLPDVLDQGPADGVGPVLGGKRHQVVLLALEHVARLHLEDLHRELVALDPDSQRRAEDPIGPLRADQGKRRGAVQQAHGSHQADDAQHVIGVEVAEEDLAEAEAHAVAHHLALGALAAIENERLALAVDGERRHVAVHRRHRGAGAEEGEAKGHRLGGSAARRLGRAALD